MINRILKIFFIGYFSFFLVFSNSSFSLTESVDLFGKVNSVDLILNDIWLKPQNPKQGEAVSVHGSVYNAGIVPSGDVSDIVTVAFIVNGEIAEINLLDNILPGIENGIEISSGPVFDASPGSHIVTVIVNYHDTLSHLRDNQENNIIQKKFKIGDMPHSVIDSEIYQFYNHETKKQQVTIRGELTDLFQEKVTNQEVFIDIGPMEKKIKTGVNGTFFLTTEIPFVNDIVEIKTSLKENYFSSDSQAVYPVKLKENQALLAFEMLDNFPKLDFKNSTFTFVIFQDSYETLFKKISTKHIDNHSKVLDNIFLTIVPSEHEYIIEIYYEGRFLSAFQTFAKDTSISKKDILIPENGQVRYRVLNEFNMPQAKIPVDNWIYSSMTRNDGMTDWIETIPTIIPNEPYAAKVTFPDGSVTWSNPFFLDSEEKKVITIVKERTDS